MELCDREPNTEGSEKIPYNAVFYGCCDRYYIYDRLTHGCCVGAHESLYARYEATCCDNGIVNVGHGPCCGEVTYNFLTKKCCPGNIIKPRNQDC